MHKNTLIFFALIVLMTLLIGATTLTFAQQEEPVPVSASSEDLMKVNILFVGAHPDDDSVATATLARYGLDHGARTGVITATRGEGGGNATGRELGPSLGAIREAEERRALAMLGVDHVYYLDEQDWAFTTSANATEQFWGYEDPLSKLVRLYRVMRPDVVITMNPSAGSGHGHHQYIAKLATEAFFLAADPTAFPEQLEGEFIEVWQPLKLYYGLGYGGTGLQASVSIPTNEYSPSQYATYADLEANALRQYRSQGFDNFFTVPAGGRFLNPEVFTLGASMLPVPAQETDLLAGITSGIDQAPAGVQLMVEPANFFASQGSDQQITVTLRNNSSVDLSDVSLSLQAAEGWTVSDTVETNDVPAGETVSATFDVSIPEDADVSAVQTVVGRFDAVDSSGAARYASKPALMQVTPPVTAQLQPIASVQIYRDWAESIGMEHIVGFASTEITLGSGETGAIPVILTNRSDEDVEVTASVMLEGDSVSLDSDEQTVTVPANSSTTVDFTASVAEGTEQGSVPVTAMLSYGDYELTDSGTVQIVPILSVPRVDAAPEIDGDLSEYADMMMYDITHTAIWEGEVENAEDLSGQFSVAYDDEFLYVAVDVTDQTVVSNIAPNDIKGHWRSDSVEITVDPLGAGASEHTLTTFKTGIFPFDTEGNVQAERDADANQGVISLTAPNMQVASSRTDTGYQLEVAIPWESVPGMIEPGGSFGFNVLLYDCDRAEAAVGENCGEARTAWSAWGQIQGNPRLWGHATLENGE